VLRKSTLDIASALLGTPSGSKPEMAPNKGLQCQLHQHLNLM
jgi:hypothetical protein